MNQVWVLLVCTLCLLASLSLQAKAISAVKESEVSSEVKVKKITKEVFPIFDRQIDNTLPLHFRIAKSSSVPLTDLSSLKVGFHNLSLSGSGQFSESSLQRMLKVLHSFRDFQKNVVIVDCRLESHGFINGRAVNWTDGILDWANVGKTIEEIERDEKVKLQQAAEARVIVIKTKGKDKHEKLIVNRVRTERDFITSLGMTYVRLPIQNYYCPSNQVIDQFVHLIANLPSHTWLHFHGQEGKERTTTCLVMRDMMLNANKVDFKTILTRHKLIGGSDLLKEYESGSLKERATLENIAFLGIFYAYCQQVPDFSISWSQWIAKFLNVQSSFIGDLKTKS